MTERSLDSKIPEVKKTDSPSIAHNVDHSSSINSPVEQILFLQRTMGNKAVERFMKSRALQGKLSIGAPGDVYEQEADRVADAVMRMPEPQEVPGAIFPIQESGQIGRPNIQKWGAGEHIELGETAGIQQVIVHPGDPAKGIPRYSMPFAEIGAFADYYASFDNMRKEAETESGRRKLDYLRWKFNQENGQTGVQPAISEAERREIDRLYLQLAATNIAHFVSGDKARDEYRKYHEQALRGAFLAGFSDSPDMMSEAYAKEGFGLHFFEDAFSSGHIRTPREDIKKWYDSHFPDAFNQFIDHIGTFMAQRMADEYLTASVDAVRPRVMEVLRPMAAPYRGAFSLGDIISKAIHDAEGSGLDVVSQLAPQQSVLGGHKWKSVGDAQLKNSPETKQMIGSALSLSKQDIDKSFRIGKDKSKGANVKAQDIIDSVIMREFPLPYESEGFMPTPDPLLPSVLQTYPWQWGNFSQQMRNIVENSIQQGIVPDLRNMIVIVPETEVVTKILVLTYTFHPRRAFAAFAADFESDPMRILETIVGRSMP